MFTFNIWGLAFNAQVYIMLASDEKHGEKLPSDKQCS